MLIFCCLLFPLVKIDAATLEATILLRYRKKFHEQLTLPPHKQILLRNTYTGEKYFILVF